MKKKSGVTNDLVGELRELNKRAWEGQKGNKLLFLPSPKLPKY